MILLNFTHPLTDQQLVRVAALVGQPLERAIDVPTHLDLDRPFGPQIVQLVEAAGLTPQQWQTEPILIVPPALNFAAVVLLAELHGRMGYFPAHLRTRPVSDSLPPRYEVAELLNLQAIRDSARKRRQEGA